LGVSPRLAGAIAAIAAFAIDQGNKWWMLDVFRIEDRPPIHVLPVLDLVLAWNRGISYSLLRADTPEGRWILLAFSLAITALFAVWLWRAGGLVTGAGLGLIIGAALANALDRWRHGAVADFYHFHTPFSLGPLSNYVFNLADVAIVAGVCLLLYNSAFAGGAGSDAVKSPRNKDSATG
jgi:signal peptidase II